MNKLTLRTHSPHQPVKDAPAIDNDYSGLIEGEFISEHKPSGKHTNFTLVLGTSGKLRGIPVQIRYQPNWWFQVVLNICPEPAQPQQLSQGN